MYLLHAVKIWGQATMHAKYCTFDKCSWKHTTNTATSTGNNWKSLLFPHATASNNNNTASIPGQSMQYEWHKKRHPAKVGRSVGRSVSICKSPLSEAQLCPTTIPWFCLLNNFAKNNTSVSHSDSIKINWGVHNIRGIFFFISEQRTKPYQLHYVINYSLLPPSVSLLINYLLWTTCNLLPI